MTDELKVALQTIWEEMSQALDCLICVDINWQQIGKIFFPKYVLSLSENIAKSFRGLLFDSYCMHFSKMN